MNTLTKATVQGAACGLMMGVVLLAGWRVWRPATMGSPATAVADVVRARKFEMVDTAGKVRARLEDFSGPQLALSDDKGQLRVTLGSGPGGSVALHLRDEQGQGRVVLSFISGLSGGPSLSLRDSEGKEQAGLYTFSRGQPSLFMQDGAGKWRAALGLDGGGRPSLTLSDAAGNPRAVLGVTSTVTIKTGQTTTRPESSLVLFDKDGKVMWQAP